MTLPNEDRHTRYTLVQSIMGTHVVKAVSRNAASALIRRVHIDPTEYPVVTWRWKVEGVLEEGNARKKSGDDYPARLYLTFDYDPGKLGFADQMKYRTLRALGYDNVPVRGLNYLWASTVPVGEVVPNPYSDWVMMLPLRSGSRESGTWVTERRNVVRDYRQVFGEDPPPINGVAIMTDTDNTGEAATAYYGDIVFSQRPADP